MIILVPCGREKHWTSVVPELSPNVIQHLGALSSFLTKMTSLTIYAENDLVHLRLLGPLHLS